MLTVSQLVSHLHTQFNTPEAQNKPPKIQYTHVIRTAPVLLHNGKGGKGDLESKLHSQHEP